MRTQRHAPRESSGWRWTSGALGSVLAALVLPPALATRGVHAEPPSPAAPSNEYGVTLALAGRTADAESVFVAVLSRTPRDAGALTNLGNLALLRGETKLALAYYGRAAERAPGDAGIELNRAVAALLQGDAFNAERYATRAVHAAGGPKQAAELLGLAWADSSAAERGADPGTNPSGGARLTPAEVDALLRRAAENLPAIATADSMRAAPVDSLSRRRPAWRSAGPRSLDTTEASALLYWKQD